VFTLPPSLPVYAPAYAPAYPLYPPPAREPVTVQEFVQVPTYAPKPVASKPYPGLVISPNPEPAQSQQIDGVGALPSKPLKLAPVPVYAPSYVPVVKPKPVVSTWQAVAESPLVPVEDVMITEATTTPTTTLATTPAPNVTTPAVTAAPVVLVVTEAEVEEGTKGADNATTVATTTVKPEPGVIYIDSLTRDVQQGLDGIIKNLPDILKGVREGLSLLENIRDIFGEADT